MCSLFFWLKNRKPLLVPTRARRHAPVSLPVSSRPFAFFAFFAFQVCSFPEFSGFFEILVSTIY